VFSSRQRDGERGDGVVGLKDGHGDRVDLPRGAVPRGAAIALHARIAAISSSPLLVPSHGQARRSGVA